MKHVELCKVNIAEYVMWEQYCFGKKNTEKIISKFSGKSKSENVLIKSLYRSFAENAGNNSVYDDNAKSILSFVSLSVSENIKKEQLLPSEIVADDVKLISADVKCQVNELKDLLHNVQSGTSDIDVITKLIGDIFSNINPQQVTNVLDCLELHKLDEVIFYSHFCQLLLQVTPPVGFSVGLCLIRQLLYLQVIDLKAPASRLLTSTILDWTKTFPKVVLEGMIMNCVRDNHLEKFQVDLVVRVIKDGLALNHVAICLRECLQAISRVEERHFLILQTLIEKKANFEDCWDSLLAKLLSASEEHGKSMAFTKLLLILLTKQDYQAQPHHLHVLTQIVNRNETFLKKSAEKALENLTKKYSNGN